MESPGAALPAPVAARQSEHLSYKFQRLRERLRQAIASGELSGKLPGERELARVFHANPKTLSKALTDLAAEGLLERSIGRGTFVRGATPQAAQSAPWLALTDASGSPALVEALRQNATIECVCSTEQVRPSFLDRFRNVIDLSASTPPSLLRNLVVRGMNLVRVGSEPGTVRTHAVLLDTAHAATLLARQLLLAGHRRLHVIETPGQQTVSSAVRMAVQRYAPSATVSTDAPGTPGAVGESGATAVLCDNEPAAQLLLQSAQGNPQFARLSVAAMGLCAGQPCCTGIYVTPTELAAAAAGLIGDVSLHRPTTLWLTGQMIDQGTIHAVPDPAFAEAA
ncbi:MAG: GntR family transcriptional regulator [Tepidisphaerales bacterium]